MNRLVLLLFLLALTLRATPSAAMTANGCDDYAEPQIAVKQLVIAPLFNTTLDLAGIQRMSIEGGQRIAGNTHETPVGLTAASLKMDSRFEISIKKHGDDPMVCAQISSFDLNFGFDDTTVYLANELPYGTCPYREVLGHEMRHVDTDQYLVQSYTPILPNLLREAVRTIGVIRASSSQAAEVEIRASVNRYMADLGKSLSQVRQKYQSQIDTPDEYARLSRSCDFALSRIIRDSRQASGTTPSYAVPSGGGYYRAMTR